jgi:hypothetical protein
MLRRWGILKSWVWNAKLELPFVPKDPGAAVPGLLSGSSVWQLLHVRVGQLLSRHAGIPQLRLSKICRPAL